MVIYNSSTKYLACVRATFRLPCRSKRSGFRGCRLGEKNYILDCNAYRTKIMIIGPYAKFEEQSTSDGNPISSTTAESPCL